MFGDGAPSSYRLIRLDCEQQRKGYNHETKMSGPVEIAEVFLYDDGRGDP